MRPLLRSRVMARREAHVREEGANQRWYRVFDALCPNWTGGVFIAIEDEKGESGMNEPMNCLRCGAQLVRLGVRTFQLGRETVAFDPHVWEGGLELEVFGCPSCGKVELFSGKVQAWAAEYECPVCHHRYPRAEDRCPRCYAKREE